MSTLNYEYASHEVTNLVIITVRMAQGESSLPEESMGISNIGVHSINNKILEQRDLRFVLVLRTLWNVPVRRDFNHDHVIMCDIPCLYLATGVVRAE